MVSKASSFNDILFKTLRRWVFYADKTLGIRMEPQTLIIFATITIIFVQVVLFAFFNTKIIYCNTPNLRLFYQARSIPNYEKLPTIYVVTPTYYRHLQKAELTRLSQTLMLVPNLHWIIVEDSDWPTESVSKLIKRLRNDYEFHAITMLSEPTPKEFKLKPNDPSWKYPKGVWQRNKALQWIRNNLVDLDRDGVIYFADDDNTYDLSLFDEMRYTRKVSVWPVGLVGEMLVERPIVRSSKVESFNSMWKSKRPFPIDMAGFAISMSIFMSQPDAKFAFDGPVGYIESRFLEQFVKSWDELEPKANSCTKVLVWHTKTKDPNLHEEKKLSKPSNSDIEW